MNILYTVKLQQIYILYIYKIPLYNKKTSQCLKLLKDNKEQVFKNLVFATCLACVIAKSLYFRLNLSKLTDVTLPTEVSSYTLKSKLNEKILKSEYNIGQLIVPQIFQKTSIKDNSVITEEFTLQGRKIALYDKQRCTIFDKKCLMSKKAICNSIQMLKQHLLIEKIY